MTARGVPTPHAEKLLLRNFFAKELLPRYFCGEIFTENLFPEIFFFAEKLLLRNCCWETFCQEIFAKRFLLRNFYYLVDGYGTIADGSPPPSDLTSGDRMWNYRGPPCGQTHKVKTKPSHTDLWAVIISRAIIN